MPVRTSPANPGHSRPHSPCPRRSAPGTHSVLRTALSLLLQRRKGRPQGLKHLPRAHSPSVRAESRVKLQTVALNLPALVPGAEHSPQHTPSTPRVCPGCRNTYGQHHKHTPSPRMTTL